VTFRGTRSLRKSRGCCSN